MEQHHENMEHALRGWINDQEESLIKCKRFNETLALEQENAKVRLKETNRSI